MIDLDWCSRWFWKSLPWLITGFFCVLYVRSPAVVAESRLRSCLSGESVLRSEIEALRSDTALLAPLARVGMGLDEEAANNIQRTVAD